MRWPARMLGEVLRHVTREPATVAYPEVKVALPPEFRGKIRFFAERCRGCKRCERDCPAGALTINKVGDRRFEAVFQLDRCIFCAQCVDSCNRDGLQTTSAFELAVLDRRTLRVVHGAPLPAATVATTGSTCAPPAATAASAR